MKCAFGVDVGGTAIKIGLIGADGSMPMKWEIPTRVDDTGSEVLPDIAEFVHARREELKNTYEIEGVGLGVPGPVDDRGLVVTSVNLHWKKPLDAAGVLSKLLEGFPVGVVNDANAAALGEAWLGAGRGAGEVVMVTLGTGVGGGVIHEGRIITGVQGAAGEIGHLCVNPKEVIPCNCGRCGCLEQYASATGVVRLAREALAASKKKSVLRQGALTAKAVWDGVKAGDALAIQVAEQFGFYLGWGLALVAGVLNPAVFVIGGGMSKAGEVMLPYIEKNYRAMALSASAHAKICLATLGNDAGMFGAGRLMLRAGEDRV
ncbi:MAG: ROK family glucokinase [Lachnospiraceae bacterium]|nr:ROK family glucokinase [Lachnospiraceae bacterium]